MFLLDTNTLIYFFKGQGRVGEHLRQTRPTLVSIPTVVIYELEYGIARSTDSSQRRLQLDATCDCRCSRHAQPGAPIRRHLV